ncbi:hypothetical protein PPL_05907 [Heterostelium album PN500]|uniref:Rho-GAP domain-containing protein n=1 Tax=Heterostelium pallidum (strain ATCC 26659 / Pp 5 / PN500) TaxID=670386 RepID=D3BBN8_HETP5|nr:hypothetical protein PPL_05907 [Heterostelium album PN500]EFA81071.1 hypothetical protein PPL_05907 [Heterostelium album PN500]|eukprot:XP_020433189.1 hypothetical protein PPL_05907 [Heterostelium album PN500]
MATRSGIYGGGAGGSGNLAGGKIFGAPLPELMIAQRKTHPELRIPLFLHNGFKYIIQYGLQIEGIFRIAGTKERVKQLQMQLDRGEQIEWAVTRRPVRQSLSWTMAIAS